MLDWLSKLATKTDVKTDSAAGDVNSKDVKSLLQHAAIVGLASAVGVLAANVGHLDLGPYTALVVPLISSALLAFQKWAADNTKE